MSFRPVDEDARQRARHDHAHSLVLEAGAGTGKTTLLVERIESLLRRGDATLPEIAAVTFTENAATTMKLRLRERLERAQSDAAASETERARATAALAVLEQAQVSTIHALCAAILGERPLECDVVPGFRVAEEAETDLLFGEAWDEWLAERLEHGDEVLLEALDAQIPLEGEGPYGDRSSLRGLARALIEQRELEPLVAQGAPDFASWARELSAKGERAAALAAQVKPGDTLGDWLPVFAEFARQAAGLSGPAWRRQAARLAGVARNVQRNFGWRPRWPSDEALSEGRALAGWAKDTAAAWSAELAAELHAKLVVALRGVGERYARAKRRRGVLDFLDLLLKARDALRDRPSLRAYFRGRFRYLIIDEFQDTDPLQVEIAELLTGNEPGRLVVVGDAKQSIYRFRRAEVSLFRRLAEHAAATPGHAVLQLTQNFRSRPAILRFANRVFGELIQASETGDQPGYEPIAARDGLAEGAAVVALRFPARFAQERELLGPEAEALARWLLAAARGGYPVRDPATQALRPSRAGDALVLARRLTQLRFLEEALERAGLRFAVEGGRSFFDRQEVHETLAVLRAFEDPGDRVALVAALRSSFFGVSDRDIAQYHLASGWLGFAEIDDSLPGGRTLAPALALLRELHELRTRVSVPALLERLFERTRALAALTGTRRGEAQVANLQKIVALARQAVELNVLTTRGFARFLEERLAGGGEEPDLPATRPGDPDTIRVLSIHKAKGLEAPIVALFDTADDLIVRPSSIALREERKIAVGFRRECQPPGWDALKAAEEGRVRAEGRRLLYVACTRARDWLVVPRPPRDAKAGDFWRDLWSRLPEATDADVVVVDAETLPAPEPEPARADLKGLAAAEGGDALAARWDAERRATIEAAALRVPRPVPALAVAARGAPPWAFAPGGRGGRDFGSLVHRLLEWTPFDEASRVGVEAMAAALAPALGLDPAAAGRAADAALRALALPVMERARRSPRLWRELRLWFTEGEELVEGVVDLVFEEGGELVVVDYKTDSIAAEQAILQAAHHAPQLQLYGRGLVQATGMKLRERIVLFTTTSQAIPV